MNVYAVTVTYGNRFEFVQKLVDRVLASNVQKVVIVDNGSPEDNKRKLAALAHQFRSKIILLTLDNNYGSAGGFHRALRVAESQSECEYIWLLDDDNLPAENALEVLLSSYRELGESCLVSLRKNRTVYRKTNNDLDVKRKFKSYNSFINYSLRHWLMRKFYYSLKRKKNDVISIPYGPYGGMFFPKHFLKTIGYPNEEMFLYMDDHEFSHRMIKSGWKIYLIRKSVVEDMETSWVGQKKYKMFSRFMVVVDGDEMKTYYLFRNCMFFERRFYITNQVEYAINRFFYKAIFYTLCKLNGKPERIALFRKASADANRMSM
jgi:GT2 family glycosyltransferase